MKSIIRQEGVCMLQNFFTKHAPGILCISVPALHLLGYIVAMQLPRDLQWSVWLFVLLIDTIFAVKCGFLVKKLNIFAYKDALTGLENRGYFYLTIAREMEKAKKGNYFLSLAVIDVDNFKLINDTYGHAAGDMTLKAIAKIFKQSVRPNDMIVRLGGEEFAIILPRTDKRGAYAVAERIRENVEQFMFSFEGVSYKVTVSIGVAAGIDLMDTDEFFKLADQAMYKAKEKKNFVVDL